MTSTIKPLLLSKIINEAPEVTEKQKRKYIPPELRKEIIDRDKHCVVCGREKNLHAHHKIPYGESTLENLITLCGYCHEYVHKIIKRKGYPYISPALAIKLREGYIG